MDKSVKNILISLAVAIGLFIIFIVMVKANILPIDFNMLKTTQTQWISNLTAIKNDFMSFIATERQKISMIGDIPEMETAFKTGELPDRIYRILYEYTAKNPYCTNISFIRQSDRKIFFAYPPYSKLKDTVVPDAFFNTLLKDGYALGSSFTKNQVLIGYPVQKQGTILGVMVFQYEGLKILAEISKNNKGIPIESMTLIPEKNWVMYNAKKDFSSSDISRIIATIDNDKKKSLMYGTFKFNKKEYYVFSIPVNSDNENVRHILIADKADVTKGTPFGSPFLFICFYVISVIALFCYILLTLVFKREEGEPADYAPQAPVSRPPRYRLDEDEEKNKEEEEDFLSSVSSEEKKKDFFFEPIKTEKPVDQSLKNLVDEVSAPKKGKTEENLDVSLEGDWGVHVPRESLEVPELDLSSDGKHQDFPAHKTIMSGISPMDEPSDTLELPELTETTETTETEQVPTLETFEAPEVEVEELTNELTSEEQNALDSLEQAEEPVAVSEGESGFHMPELDEVEIADETAEKAGVGDEFELPTLEETPETEPEASITDEAPAAEEFEVPSFEEENISLPSLDEEIPQPEQTEEFELPTLEGEADIPVDIGTELPESDGLGEANEMEIPSFDEEPTSLEEPTGLPEPTGLEEQTGLEEESVELPSLDEEAEPVLHTDESFELPSLDEEVLPDEMKEEELELPPLDEENLQSEPEISEPKEMEIPAFEEETPALKDESLELPSLDEETMQIETEEEIELPSLEEEPGDGSSESAQLPEFGTEPGEMEIPSFGEEGIEITQLDETAELKEEGIELPSIEEEPKDMEIPPMDFSGKEPAEESELPPFDTEVPGTEEEGMELPELGATESGQEETPSAELPEIGDQELELPSLEEEPGIELPKLGDEETEKESDSFFGNDDGAEDISLSLEELENVSQISADEPGDLPAPTVSDIDISTDENPDDVTLAEDELKNISELGEVATDTSLPYDELANSFGSKYNIDYVAVYKMSGDTFVNEGSTSEEFKKITYDNDDPIVMKLRELKKDIFIPSDIFKFKPLIQKDEDLFKTVNSMYIRGIFDEGELVGMLQYFSRVGNEKTKEEYFHISTKMSELM